MLLVSVFLSLIFVHTNAGGHAVQSKFIESEKK